MMYRIVVVMCLCGMILGCADDGGLKPVSGVVRIDGQPAQGVNVIFVPLEGGRANSMAQTQADGHFSLRYTSQIAGTLPGEYKVLITKEESDTGKELIPERFSSGSKTTLRATVEEGRDNDFNFEIESK